MTMVKPQQQHVMASHSYDLVRIEDHQKSHERTSWKSRGEAHVHQWSFNDQTSDVPLRPGRSHDEKEPLKPIRVHESRSPIGPL
ncbi:hypothetical protein EVAR_39866_1 [Eumeta japonica]|uniref:Uncharacterized protein n=1 Tax=Eumeta variegata TaxID=151549 RepID=A0A4C1WT12_EUMVA|nr:hypothetical protein EVAR_39866_1 [Eumeta japonica]